MEESLARSNSAWVRELRQAAPECNRAIQDLRMVLFARLKQSFPMRPDVTSAILEDYAQEAVLKVMASLDTFRGESQFLTWATKIAVRLVLTDLRRKRWNDVSLENLQAPDLKNLKGKAKSPEQQAIENELLGLLRHAVITELSDKQRQALIAIRFNGMPLEEVARRMGSNRNAVYKLMHDARKRLKSALLTHGLTEEEILEACS